VPEAQCRGAFRRYTTALLVPGKYRVIACFSTGRNTTKFGF
jgi:hypothetical protein